MTDYLTDKPLNMQFMMYPRFLTRMEMSETAKLAYILLLDRARLSQKNGWMDEYGHVYMIYTLSSLAKDMNKSLTTVKESLKTLEENDLIERVSQGKGLPGKIYIRIPDSTEGHVMQSPQSRSDSHPSHGQKSGSHRVGKPATNNKNREISIKTHRYEYGGNSL